MRIGRHDGFAGGCWEFDEGEGPIAQPGKGLIDCLADEEAHVGSDLLVAAAARVEFEGEWADRLLQPKFYEVVDVFGFFGGEVSRGSDLSQSVERRRQLGVGEDACRRDGVGVGLRGQYFLRQQAIVEGERTLPFLELLVQWFAEATGPHFCCRLIWPRPSKDFPSK